MEAWKHWHTRARRQRGATRQTRQRGKKGSACFRTSSRRKPHSRPATRTKRRRMTDGAGSGASGQLDIHLDLDWDLLLPFWAEVTLGTDTVAVWHPPRRQRRPRSSGPNNASHQINQLVSPRPTPKGAPAPVFDPKASPRQAALVMGNDGHRQAGWILQMKCLNESFGTTRPVRSCGAVAVAINQSCMLACDPGLVAL